MKWFKKSYIVALAAVLSFSACEYEDDYTPAPAAGADTVYFQEPSQDLTFGPEVSEIPVTVLRSDTLSAKTYNINLESDYAQYFEVPSTVSFAVGDSAKTIIVKMKDNFPLFVSVNANLRLDGNSSVDIYSKKLPIASLTILKEDFATVSHGVYTDYYTEEGHECELQYSLSLDLYRFYHFLGGQASVTFKFNKETNFGKSVNDQLNTGIYNTNYGWVYAVPAGLKPSGKEVDDNNPDGDNIFFDAANKVWYIGHEWTVSAGSFGADIDTFEVTD